MDNLPKQMRVRFSALGEESQNDQYNTREESIPPQKTVSFKREREKAQNWLPRQFSGQMSVVDDPSDGEFVVAIAAAVYAITSLEQEGSPNQKKALEGMGRSPTKIKSKREDSTNKSTNTSKISRWFSGKGGKEVGGSTGEKSMSKSTTSDQRMLEDSIAGRKIPEKAIGTTPTIKKTPTFSDRYLNGTGSKRYEGGQDMRAGRPEGFQYPNTIKSSKEETKADVWEREQMERIRKWYEKMNSTILQWENEKKTKAKHRLERKEREMEQRRAKVLQEYRNEISRIDKITGGARTVSVERKRNDEYKTKETAKQIRATGKVPQTCFCF